MSEKRKHVMLDLSEKLEIVKRLRQGESATRIATLYGVGRTTVNDIKRNAEKLEHYVSKMQTADGKFKVRKTMKPATLEQLDTVMYEWFVQTRSQGIPLSGPIIMAKAIDMNRKLGGNDSFKASTGWLGKFKFRHGIRQLDMTGEKSSADSAELAEDKLVEQISQRNLISHQVYNCCETSLIWKSLPQKILAAVSEESASEYKIQKDRVSVMICANSSSTHKLPLLIVGKPKKSRCFNDLPVNYYAQKNAWMSQDIVQDWFHKVFVPSVRVHLASMNLPKEAMLVIDRVPTHPTSEIKSEDGKITCHFVPANVTELLKRMDQSIIEKLKHRYRKTLIQDLVSTVVGVKEFWRSYTIKDAILNMADAWAKFPNHTLNIEFDKLYPGQTAIKIENDNQEDEEILQLCSNIPGSENISSGEINEWLNMDKTKDCLEILNDDELIQNVISEDSEIFDEEEHITFEETSKIINPDEAQSMLSKVIDEEEHIAFEETSKIISHNEAKSMLSKVIEWFEVQEEADATQLLLLREIHNIAAKKAH